MVCGRSLTLSGNVMGSLALGLTSPKRMLATASAPLLPAYQASSTPLTLSIQGMVTAVPVSSTTMVLRICRRHLRDQRILVVGQRQVGQIHALAGPLVRKHDGDVGRFRQCRRRRRIRAGIELHVGGTGLCFDRLQTAMSGTTRATATRVRCCPEDPPAPSRRRRSFRCQR